MTISTFHDFTCPKCNGHYFRSVSTQPNKNIRQCKNDLCKFRWPEQDDDKYIKYETLEEYMARYKPPTPFINKVP